MFSLKGKSAVVTGGGSGIGRAISILFAAQGAHVHILELNAESGAAVVNEIVSEGGRASVHSCDVSDQQKVVTLFESIAEINILVNNAGIAHVGKADTTSSEDFERVYNVNVKGAYNCLFAVIPIMKKHG